MNNTELKTSVEIIGHTKVWKNDELVYDKHNAIVAGTGGIGTPAGLKEYFADSMNLNIDRAINDLFEFSNTLTGVGSLLGLNYNLLGLNPPVAAFSAHDGIVISTFDTLTDGTYGANTAYAMITTTLPPTNTFGAKWKGTFTATSAVSTNNAVIGHSLKNNTLYNALENIQGHVSIEKLFTTAYAKQAFQTQTLAAGDTLTVEWEIYVA